MAAPGWESIECEVEPIRLDHHFGRERTTQCVIIPDQVYPERFRPPLEVGFRLEAQTHDVYGGRLEFVSEGSLLFSSILELRSWMHTQSRVNVRPCILHWASGSIEFSREMTNRGPMVNCAVQANFLVEIPREPLGESNSTVGMRFGFIEADSLELRRFTEGLSNFINYMFEPVRNG